MMKGIEKRYSGHDSEDEGRGESATVVRNGDLAAELGGALSHVGHAQHELFSGTQKRWRER